MAVRDIADHSGENTYSAVDQKRRRIWVSFNLHSLMRNYPSFNDEPKANLNWLETNVVSLTVTSLKIYTEFYSEFKELFVHYEIYFHFHFFFFLQIRLWRKVLGDKTQIFHLSLC